MLFGKKKRRIVRVLVVEDEPLVAFDTEHFLSASGFEIAATVDTVAEALVTIAEIEDLHLVLVDLGLADGSGLDVARAARDKGVEVLFVTGADPGEVEGLAVGCLTKPYPQRDLIAAIDVIEAVGAGRKLPKVPASLRLFPQLSDG